jgi:hypothetical protein
MLKWLITNYLAVSAGALILSIAAALLFLASYFLVFHHSLAWMIEYSDINKVLVFCFILFSAALGVVAILVDLCVSGALGHHKMTRYFVRWAVITFVASLVLMLISELSYFHIGPHRWYLYILLSIAFFYVALYMSFLMYHRHFHTMADIDPKAHPAQSWHLTIPIAITAALSLACLGFVYGIWVKEISNSTVMICTTNDNFPSAKIIAWFSHHVAFYSNDRKNDRIIILPTDSITRVVLGDTNVTCPSPNILVVRNSL